ncbi:MAG: ABC transporter ATP-binding protein [Bosea sp.]|uniref:ABC transporter ATP-binding protein n=1 Tax=Bosea sp. (in: a-proteobacteria) TaxID=1871050 RepID=UPI001AC6785F|nr:ABC transporter ATP-binding protein [Bosea sp. (in: a-proteobacteria)]MBN9454328.1 ABC transporter ATP-binding protein [Bosea sp. (in: a-proteobacteria)]
MTDVLTIDNVSVNFGGVKALSDVSFGLRPAEVLGLIGPNGAGKTTLLNTISGIAPLAGGDVRADGVSLAGMRPFRITRRGIARTFQIVRPFAHLTVAENAAVGATFASHARPSREEAVARAFEALAQVGLTAKADALPHQLTLSERKRLELARALAMKPRILLLDEVMAGLNLAEVEPIIELVRGLARSGLSIILVEHVMKAVMSTCDRIVVLQFGRKIAEGTPEQIASDRNVIEAYLGQRFAERRAREAAGRTA